MPDNQNIAKSAFDLLAREPQNGGLTMSLAGGGPDIVLPGPDPTGLLLLIGSPKLLRPAEARAQYDLRVFADEHAGQFNVRVERITGMAALATIPDPSEVVTHFKVGDLNDATVALGQALDEHFSGVNLAVSKLSYRSSKFAECTLDASRGKPAGRLSLWRPTDSNLSSFAADVVERALTWGPSVANAEQVSVWFYATGESGAIYVTIKPDGRRRFTIEMEDRISWPWKKKSSKRVGSIAEVQQTVADYVARTHGFRIHAWHVYFNHTVRQTETDLDAWV